MRERSKKEKTIGGLGPKGRRAISALSRAAKSGLRGKHSPKLKSYLSADSYYSN